MRISLLAFTAFSLLINHTVLPDATQDLIAAITAQNVTDVSNAINNGAVINAEIKFLAFEQITLACQHPTPILVPSTAFLLLIIASFLHNKCYALANVAGIITGAGLSAYKQSAPAALHNKAQQAIATLHLDEVATYASTAGLLASAWSSNYKFISTLGTAGLGLLYYQGYKLNIASEIYKMVDPELTLLPELA